MALVEAGVDCKAWLSLEGAQEGRLIGLEMSYYYYASSLSWRSWSPENSFC